MVIPQASVEKLENEKIISTFGPPPLTLAHSLESKQHSNIRWLQKTCTEHRTSLGVWGALITIKFHFYRHFRKSPFSTVTSEAREKRYPH